MNRLSLLYSGIIVVVPSAFVLPGCGGGSGSLKPTPTATTTSTPISTTLPTATVTPSPTTTATPTSRPARETYINVASAQIIEGNSGKKAMKFVFSAYDTYGDHFSLPFSYTTINGSAVAGQDYIATSGKGSIITGSIITISVPIIGDKLLEEDETFRLQVIAPSRYHIAENVGTIVSDERPVPTVTSTPVEP